MSFLIRQLATLARASLLLCAATAGLHAQKFPLSPNLWDNPDFRERFMGSYGFDTSVTPKISKEEQELFKSLASTIDRNPSAAASRLRGEIGPDSSAALDYTLANLLVQSRQISEAKRRYKDAIEKFPNFYRAYKNLALVLVNEGEYDEALPHLLKGLELGGTDGALYGPLALVYLNRNKPKQALTAYNQALIFQPDNLQWQQGKLRCLMDIGRYTDAIALIEEMILEEPANNSYWKWQANAYLSEEMTDLASANLEVIKRMGKADAPSLALLGDIYLNKGMNGLALDNYVAAAEKGELDPKRLLRTAEGFVRRRLWEQAAEYLARTEDYLSELNPDQQAAFRNYQARTAIGRDNLEKASGILEALVEEDPMNGEALLTLGNLRRELDQPEEAAFAYEQAAKIEETRVNALVEHARMLIGNKDYVEAIPLLERVVVLEPGPRYEDFLDRVEKAARVAKGQI